MFFSFNIRFFNVLTIYSNPHMNVAIKERSSVCLTACYHLNICLLKERLYRSISFLIMY